MFQVTITHDWYEVQPHIVAHTSSLREALVAVRKHLEYVVEQAIQRSVEVGSFQELDFSQYEVIELLEGTCLDARPLDSVVATIDTPKLKVYRGYTFFEGFADERLLDVYSPPSIGEFLQYQYDGGRISMC